MNKIKGLVLFGLLLPWMSAFAVPVLEGDDAIFQTTGTEITFEVLHISGGINAGGNLEFGAYAAGDTSNTTTIFDSGISLGDTYSSPTSPGVLFGFYLSNVGGGFGGPFTLYSDTSLNPAIPGFVGAGLDAMVADITGPDSFTIEWEDLYLPILPGVGTDLIVRVTGATVPEPTSLALLGLGALALMRRRQYR